MSKYLVSIFAAIAVVFCIRQVPAVAVGNGLQMDFLQKMKESGARRGEASGIPAQRMPDMPDPEDMENAADVRDVPAEQKQNTGRNKNKKRNGKVREDTLKALRAAEKLPVTADSSLIQVQDTLVRRWRWPIRR